MYKEMKICTAVQVLFDLEVLTILCLPCMAKYNVTIVISVITILSLLLNFYWPNFVMMFCNSYIWFLMSLVS